MRSLHRARAIVAALALTLALPMGALANDQVVAVDEVAEIGAATSLVGVPAAIDYGDGLAGTTRTGASSASPLVASTNNPGGVRLAVSFTSLTGAGSPIVASNHRLVVVRDGTVKEPDFTACPGTDGTDWPGGVRAYTSGQMTICDRTTPGIVSFPAAQSQMTSWAASWQVQLVIPAGQTPGTYSGTATFSALEH